MLLFVVGNGRSLWSFARHETRLLPGQITRAATLVFLDAIRPEERFLHERFCAPYDCRARRVRRWL